MSTPTVVRATFRSGAVILLDLERHRCRRIAGHSLSSQRNAVSPGCEVVGIPFLQIGERAVIFTKHHSWNRNAPLTTSPVVSIELIEEDSDSWPIASGGTFGDPRS